jgi:hypothetical protein
MGNTWVEFPSIWVTAVTMVWLEVKIREETPTDAEVGRRIYEKYLEMSDRYRDSKRTARA